MTPPVTITPSAVPSLSLDERAALPAIPSTSAGEGRATDE